MKLPEEYEISDEEAAPAELEAARAAGKQIQCLTAIGWIDVDAESFRYGVTYRVKP